MKTKPKTDNPERNTGALSRSVELNVVRAEGEGGEDVVRATVSTETAVLEDVYYGDRWQTVYRILDHGPESVDMARIADMMVVTDEHFGDQIGSIFTPQLAERKLGGAITFCSGQRAQDIKSDAVQSLRRNLSVDGWVDPASYVREDDRDGVPVLRAMRWQPHRVAFVPLQADPAAGVGRELNTKETTETIMSEEKKDTTPAITADDVTRAAEAAKKEGNAERGAEVIQMHALARMHGVDDEMLDASIKGGDGISVFREKVLEGISSGKINKVKRASEVQVPKKDAERFSIMRAVKSLDSGGDVKADFERGLSNEIAEECGRRPRGIYVPHGALLNGAKRDLTVAGTGSNIVATNLEAGSFIEALRNRMVTISLGAQVMPGLRGDVAIPKQTGAGTAYWVAEGVPVTESTQTLGQVTGTPHTVGAFTDISRKLLQQSTPAADKIVTDDLVAVLAIAIDLAGIAGTGADAQPTGIKLTSNVNEITISTPNTPTYVEMLGFPGACYADNVQRDGGKWAISAAVWEKLAATTKDSGSGQFVLNVESKTICGYPYEMTQQVGANAAMFGFWDNLVYGLWGALDINLDDKALSTSGGLRIVALQDVDVMVRNAQAFSFADDVTT